MGDVKVKTFHVGFVCETASSSLKVLDRQTEEIEGTILQIEDTYCLEKDILVRAVVYKPW